MESINSSLCIGKWYSKTTGCPAIEITCNSFQSCPQCLSFPNCAWCPHSGCRPANTVDSQCQYECPSNSSNTSELNSGSIIAIVASSIALLSLIALVIWHYYYRKKRHYYERLR
jgi:hypothetical protein